MDLTLLVVRVMVGIVFFAHGAQKLLGWYGGYGIKGTLGYFGSLGIPPVVGYIVIFVEFFGGIALALGFLTRLDGIGLFLMMMVALFRVHAKNGFFMNWGSAGGKGEGFEYTLTLAVVALGLALSGAGAYSIDAFLRAYLL